MAGLRDGVWGGGRRGDGARLELITTLFMVSEPTFEQDLVNVPRVPKCITHSLSLKNVMKASDRSYGGTFKEDIARS